MRGVEYDREAGSYQQARGMSLAAIAPWRDAVSPWIAAGAGRPVLDLGAGTGQFARAFRQWFGCAVVALEPSAAMRAEGRRLEAPGDDVRWVGGRADDLPLGAHVCAAAWLSTVLHHVGDLRRCAAELRRVLAPGAPVLIRSGFPERADGITLLRYFPWALRRMASFPTVEHVAHDFASAGFDLLDVREVAQVSAASLQDFRARVVAGRHADSLLVALDDAEFAQGLARLDADVAKAPHAAPVHDRLTFLVLR